MKRRDTESYYNKYKLAAASLARRNYIKMTGEVEEKGCDLSH